MATIRSNLDQTLWWTPYGLNHLIWIISFELFHLTSVYNRQISMNTVLRSSCGRFCFTIWITLNEQRRQAPFQTDKFNSPPIIIDQDDRQVDRLFVNWIAIPISIGLSHNSLSNARSNTSIMISEFIYDGQCSLNVEYVQATDWRQTSGHDWW